MALVALVWAGVAPAGAAGGDGSGTWSAVLDAFGVQRPRVRMPAPAFDLAGVEGGRVRLRAARGRVVLIHFWATWCVACRREMPWIERLWRDHRNDGLAVLGVNVDRGDGEGVRAFVREHALRFPSGLDPEGRVRNRYEVRVLPTTYLVGRDGRIIGRILGARDWSSPAARALIRALLRGEPRR